MSAVLRRGLLEGVTVAGAGDAAVLARCAELGAATPAIEADLQDEDAVAAAVQALEVMPDVLVCATGELDGAFIATRAMANAWIGAERGAKVVLIAPRDGAPVRAALENLARTLSVEWARYGITPTAILPGPETGDDEVAELVAFLASPAGDYYSGCAFTLA